MNKAKSNEFGCLYHADHETRISENTRRVEKFEDKFDSMKNMLIAGLFSSLGQLLLMIIGMIFAYFKLKGGS